MKNNFSLSFLAIVLVLSFACLSLISCEPAAKSASQAFDNANSVITSGSEKLFMPVDPTPTPAM